VRNNIRQRLDELINVPVPAAAQTAAAADASSPLTMDFYVRTYMTEVVTPAGMKKQRMMSAFGTRLL
jgi:hypothetical protein